MHGFRIARQRHRGDETSRQGRSRPGLRAGGRAARPPAHRGRQGGRARVEDVAHERRPERAGAGEDRRTGQHTGGIQPPAGKRTWISTRRPRSAWPRTPTKRSPTGLASKRVPDLRYWRTFAAAAGHAAGAADGRSSRWRGEKQHAVHRRRVPGERGADRAGQRARTRCSPRRSSRTIRGHRWWYFSNTTADDALHVPGFHDSDHSRILALPAHRIPRPGSFPDCQRPREHRGCALGGVLGGGDEGPSRPS